MQKKKFNRKCTSKHGLRVVDDQSVLLFIHLILRNDLAAASISTNVMDAVTCEGGGGGGAASDVKEGARGLGQPTDETVTPASTLLVDPPPYQEPPTVTVNTEVTLLGGQAQPKVRCVVVDPPTPTPPVSAVSVDSEPAFKFDRTSGPSNQQPDYHPQVCGLIVLNVLS